MNTQTTHTPNWEDRAIDAACEAHWPSFRNMRPDVARHRREQMKKALAAYKLVYTPVSFADAERIRFARATGGV